MPATAVRGARRWLYAGDDPSFELTGLERVSTADATMAAARELRDPYLDAIGAPVAPECLAGVVGEPPGRQAPLPQPVRAGVRPGGRPGAGRRRDARRLLDAGPARGAATGCPARAPRERSPAACAARPRRLALRLAWPVLRGSGRRAPTPLLDGSPPAGRGPASSSSERPATGGGRCSARRRAARGFAGRAPSCSSPGSTSAASGPVASTPTRTSGRSGPLLEERGRARRPAGEAAAARAVRAVRPRDACGWCPGRRFRTRI